MGWDNYTANTWNAASATNISYVVNLSPEDLPGPTRPESALEWLDRRVNEVRLPLAA